jgi:cobalt-zinc-cadmium efflux system protein
MSHTHGHGHAAGNNLQVAFGLNLVFTVAEVAGGLWTGSVAVLSDAVHDAGDCLSLGLAWYLQRLSLLRANPRFTYGYRRLSALGALTTGLVLLVGLGFVVSEAVGRLHQPRPVLARGVVALAVAGVLFNGAAAWRLRGAHSLNGRVAAWHLLEDTLGWAAVLVGGLVMAVWDLPVIDPLLSLGISLFVLWNVVRNLRRVGLVLLQAAPPGFDPDELDRELAGVPGVVGSHHTHTWTLDGERHVFSTHLVLGPDSDRATVVAAKRRVHELLRGMAFEHITVEVELAGETCAADPDGPC